MSTRKTIKVWLFRCLLIFGILTVAALVLAPRLINLEMVRSNITDKLSRDLGGEITYRQLQLSYIPSPHVVIHKAEILVADSYQIKIHRLKVYPQLVPLLKGRLQVAFIRLEYADYFMKLPQISDTEQKPDEITSIDDIIKSITATLRTLPEFKLPDLKLKIKYGKVNLVDPFGRMFKLRQLQGDYHRSPNKLDFSIRCQSNLWDQVVVKGSLNPMNFEGRGRIQLSHFRPQDLMAYLFPNSAMQVTDTKANVTIAFELDGNGNIEADVDGAIPSLQLSQGKEKLVIKGSSIRGKVQVGGSVAKATITEFGLKYPQMEVTGTFSYNQKLRDFRLKINGSEIDAAAVRQTALSLAGKSETVRNIFNIVRGGHVPWMTFQVQGRAMAELGNLENIVIKGKMTQGKIFIPGAELDLEDVIGDATISEGILLGENLQARLENTHGQEGRLRVALNGDIAPFELKIGVNADLSQLPPVLNRIVEDKDFLNELARIKDVGGSATGILTLGDDLQDINAKVEVSKARFTAFYTRIPYPVLFEGGNFVYEPTRIEIDNFYAKIGQSSLGKLSSSIGWAGTPNLTVQSDAAKFNLAELFAWLQSFERFKENLKNISSLEGTVSVQNLHIKGPFFSPHSWHFQTRGVANNLRLTSNKLTEPLHVTTAPFSWQGTQIALDDVEASLGKSTISQLSADVDLGKSPSFEVRSKSIKLITDEIYPWILSSKKLYSVFKDFSVTGGILTLHDLDLKGPIHHPDRWQYDLTCKMQDLVMTSKSFRDSATVNKGTFRLSSEISNNGSHNTVNLETTNVTWGNSQLNLTGGINLVQNSILLDLNVTADGTDWHQIKSILDYLQNRKPEKEIQEPNGHLLGTLKFQTDSFNYESYRVQPLHTDVSFEADQVIIAVNQAALCNISMRGLLKISGQTLEIYLVPTAKELDLAPAIT